MVCIEPMAHRRVLLAAKALAVAVLLSPAVAVPLWQADVAAPAMPEAYSARVLQQHLDGESQTATTRFFAVYHDFSLKMQRVDHRWCCVSCSMWWARLHQLT